MAAFAEAAAASFAVWAQATEPAAGRRTPPRRARTDDNGFFAVAEAGLTRVRLDLEPVWVAEVEHGAPGGYATASAVLADDVFAFMGTNADDGHNDWVTVLAAP